MWILEDVATIAGGIVAAAAIIGAACGLYWRTAGRASDHERRLRRLGTNAQLSYFSAVLGRPPAMRGKHALRDSVGANYFNCIWVDPMYFVAALIDQDETVCAFAVTTRDKRFRPELRTARGERADPTLKVRLGVTKFSDVPSRPSKVVSALGARRFGYLELYYLGNPGHYQTFGLAVNDAGYIGHFSAPIPEMRHTVETPHDSEFDDGAIGRFRSGSLVNSWLVLGPSAALEPHPLIYWPDGDELRTFA